MSQAPDGHERGPSRRGILPWLFGLACLGAVLAAAFGGVLAGGEQFAYRDAGNYYYPLYQAVQQQWEAGHPPLWEPGENGGMPLLGNPTAAVLYPGKLIFAVLPFAWAMRLYVIGHVLLALAATWALARTLGAGRTGSALAAFAYAFGAPVLFMHSNVIYLVGAAWMPLGFRAADLWVRRGSNWGIVQLIPVLAMQALGGDIQAAYLTALIAMGYAVGHVLVRPEHATAWAAGIGGLVAVWCAGVVLLAWLWNDLPAYPSWLPGPRWPRLGVPLVLLIALGRIIERQRGRASRLRTLGLRVGPIMMAGLAGFCLAGVQLIPVAETALKSYRADDDAPFDPYAFGVEPWRAIELLWPNVTGAVFPENHSWILTLDPTSGQEFWTPSLYMGGLTVVLALVGIGRAGSGPGRAWLTAVAVVMLLGSLGRFGGPLWIPRQIPFLAGVVDPAHGPDDAFGSVYGLMTAVLPIFGAFRFPAKLMVPASLAIAVLAGLGWSRLVRTPAARVGVIALALLMFGVSLALLGLSILGQDRLLAAWAEETDRLATLAGPLDARGALFDIRHGLIKGSVVFGLTALLAMAARSRPLLAGVGAVSLMSVDLILANAGLIWTVPQRELEREPAALRAIVAAEASEPSPSTSFRVFRMPPWYPPVFFESQSPDRIREIVAWERATLQPSHGITVGIVSTFNPGVLESFDFLWFFRPMARPLDARTAAALNLPAGRPVLYYPRRGVDLWASRYVLLPINPGDWMDEHRGYASLIDQAVRIYPDLDIPTNTFTPEQIGQDWQLLRNEAAFPRAWIVHDARVIEPLKAGDAEVRDRVMQRLLYQNDPLWSEPGRPVLDLRTTALIEAADGSTAIGPLPRTPPAADERVAITLEEPGRVRLTAELDQPGLVILADSYYPGWRLTIDGEPSPILRANRMMRGAWVPAGRHELVYTYRPGSLRFGAGLTFLGVVLTGVLILHASGWFPVIVRTGPKRPRRRNDERKPSREA